MWLNPPGGHCIDRTVARCAIRQGRDHGARLDISSATTGAFVEVVDRVVGPSGR